MINVFNRKEVCITYDMAEQARVRDILKQNNIEYDLDTKRIESPLGGQSLISSSTSPLGAQVSVNSDMSNRCLEHKVYVKKSDYELATEKPKISASTEIFGSFFIFSNRL